MKTITTRWVLSLMLLCTTSAYADVYEYVDEQGMSYYSNVSVDERYHLMIEVPPEVVANSDNSHTAKSASNNTASTINTATAQDDIAAQAAINNSAQVLAHVKQSAINNQLDSELILAVMHVESANNSQARSPKGAQGLMQLMPATARRFGVKDNFDPLQNIEGGAKYLKVLLKLFHNDVSLALAGYNAGEYAVMKYGNRIPPYQETQAYVPKVLKLYQALLRQKGKLAM
jgi:soluble lytic murein transglycosylase-like protein